MPTAHAFRGFFIFSKTLNPRMESRRQTEVSCMSTIHWRRVPCRVLKSYFLEVGLQAHFQESAAASSEELEGPRPRAGVRS